MDELVKRSQEALKNIVNGTAKVGRTGIDRAEVIARVEIMAGTSYYTESKKRAI